MQGGIRAYASIYGDAEWIGDAARNEGHDNIRIVGDLVAVESVDSVTGNIDSIGCDIAGDAYSLENGAYNTGNDTILIEGNASGGQISGDFLEGDAAGVINRGDDTITVTGSISGYTHIYGDFNETGSSVSSIGHDTITIGGDMTGNSSIYGDADLSYDSHGGVTGDDTITINGNFTAGHIGAGFGADTITLHDAVSGTGTLDVGADTDADSIYLNGSGGTLTIDNFNITHDKLYLGAGDNAVLQPVMGSGTSGLYVVYGGYTVIFNNLTGALPISQNIVYTEAQYDALANSVSPATAYIQEHDGSNAVFGNTSITIQTDQDRDVNIVGDTTTATTGTGGNDTILVENTATDGIIAGDAITISGSFVGGRDTITVKGSVSTGAVIYGDAQNGAGTSTSVSWSGNDSITIKGGMASASIHGDAESANAGYSAGSDTITLENNMTGGAVYGDITYMSGTLTSVAHDTIRLTNSISNNSEIYGDALDIGNDAISRGSDTITIEGSAGLSHIYGDTSTLRDTGRSEGHDSITIGGTVTNALIYGDAETMEGSARSVGNDTISIGGDFAGTSVIYGDAKTLSGTAATQGDDSITITGNMKSGTIYGDVLTSDAGNTAVGRDSVTIGGNMEGGQIWLDTTTSAGYTTGVNDDTVTFAAHMNGGTIYRTQGTDTINIGTVDPGVDTVNISMMGAENLTLLFNAGSESGDTYNFTGDFSTTVATIHLLGVDKNDLPTITYNSANINGDLAVAGRYVNGNATFIVSDVYTTATGGMIEGDPLGSSLFEKSSIVFNGNLDENDAIYGDKFTVGPGGTGGDDLIMVTGSVGSLLASDTRGNVFGDAFTLDSMSGNFACGNDHIIVNKDFVDGEISGDARNVSETANVGGHDIIVVHGGMHGGALYGDAVEVSGSGNISGNDHITINGNMSGGGIFGDAGTVTTTGTQGGDDTILVTGGMSGGSIRGGAGNDSITIADIMSSGNIDGGAGNDTISVGSADAGATVGSITGGEGNDSITVYVSATTQGSLSINADGMNTSGESIDLHAAGTGEAHVTVSNLDASATYAAGSFTVNGVDITTAVGAALDSSTEVRHDNLIIYFS